MAFLSRATSTLFAASVMFGFGCGTDQDDNSPGGGTGSGSGGGPAVQMPGFVRVDLISDQAGVAKFQDADLVNPWGLASDARSFWIANNGSGKLAAVDGTGAPARAQPNKVELAEGITGLAINTSDAFQIHDGSACGPATILVASEAGVIFGFNPAVSAKPVVVVDRSAVGASYKGLAIISVPGRGMVLLAADFHNARIDVFDASFELVTATTTTTPPGTVKLPPVGPNVVGPSVLRSGSHTSSPMFVAPNLRAGLAPFNVALLNDQVYVSYAVQDADKADDVPGVGNGRIDVFDLRGNFVMTLIDGGLLNAPWGMVIAPADFSTATANMLIVGNFGDGTLLAIDPVSGASLGQLLTSDGRVLAIPGLWGLAFGNGKGVGLAGALYFTAGVDDEMHGLFGYLIAG